jgi:polyhydroxyalkanoate synthesis regulator phasin
MTTNLAQASLKLLIISSIVAQSAVALADTIDERQEKQSTRIQQGVKSGELTDNEAQKLEQSQEKIEVKEAKYEADGNVSNKEQRKLRKMQAKQSKKIYRQKHDRQDVAH